jgi:hypothetical protein
MALDAAAQLASKRLPKSGLLQLPHITPHTLRRTYVSIMLLATNFDVPFVQSQVRHSDSKLTMDVYAQLLDRSKRSHGKRPPRFDRTPRPPLRSAAGRFWPTIRPTGRFWPLSGHSPRIQDWLGYRGNGAMKWA